VRVSADFEKIIVKMLCTSNLVYYLCSIINNKAGGNRVNTAESKMGLNRQDKFGNEIGDGTWNIGEYVMKFPEYPQISHVVNKSDTTESTYVTYSNSETEDHVTVRFSMHECNAVRFGDQLDGYSATREQVLYRLGLKKRVFIPRKKLSIYTKFLKDSDIDKYVEAELTIQEMYALGAGADLSPFVGKRSKNGKHLIMRNVVEEIEDMGRDYFGNPVRVGEFKYID